MTARSCIRDLVSLTKKDAPHSNWHAGQLALSLPPLLIILIHHHCKLQFVPGYRFSCQAMRVMFHVLFCRWQSKTFIVRMTQVELLHISAQYISYNNIILFDTSFSLSGEIMILFTQGDWRGTCLTNRLLPSHVSMLQTGDLLDFKVNTYTHKNHIGTPYIPTNDKCIHTTKILLILYHVSPHMFLFFSWPPFVLVNQQGSPETLPNGGLPTGSSKIPDARSFRFVNSPHTDGIGSKSQRWFHL